MLVMKMMSPPIMTDVMPLVLSLRHFKCLISFDLTAACAVDTSVIPILQSEKLRYRKLKYCNQCHLAKRGVSQDANSGCLISESLLINQLSLPDGREKAGGCAHASGNEPAYALSSLGVKALVLCLEAMTNFELKMWKNPLFMKVSFLSLVASPDNSSILN